MYSSLFSLLSSLFSLHPSPFTPTTRYLHYTVGTQAGTCSLAEADLQNDAGMYGGILIGVGLVGAGIAGPILDKTHVRHNMDRC